MTAPLTEQPTDCGSCRFFADARGEDNESVCTGCDDLGMGPLRRLKNGTYRRTEPHKVKRTSPSFDARSSHALPSI